jgi:hypothetical protein
MRVSLDFADGKLRLKMAITSAQLRHRASAEMLWFYWKVMEVRKEGLFFSRRPEGIHERQWAVGRFAGRIVSIW